MASYNNANNAQGYHNTNNAQFPPTQAQNQNQERHDPNTYSIYPVQGGYVDIRNTAEADDHLDQEHNASGMKDVDYLKLLIRSNEENLRRMQEATDLITQAANILLGAAVPYPLNPSQDPAVLESQGETQPRPAANGQKQRKNNKKRPLDAVQEQTQHQSQKRNRPAAQQNMEQNRHAPYENAVAGPSGSSSRGGSQTTSLKKTWRPILPRPPQEGDGLQPVVDEDGRYIGSQSGVAGPTAEMPAHSVGHHPPQAPTGPAPGPSSAPLAAPSGTPTSGNMKLPELHDALQFLGQTVDSYPAVTAQPAAVPPQSTRLHLHRSVSAPNSDLHEGNRYAVNGTVYEGAARHRPHATRSNQTMLPPSEVAQLVPIDPRYTEPGRQVVAYGPQQPMSMEPQQFNDLYTQVEDVDWGFDDWSTLNKSQAGEAERELFDRPM